MFYIELVCLHSIDVTSIWAFVFFALWDFFRPPPCKQMTFMTASYPRKALFLCHVNSDHFFSRNRTLWEKMALNKFSQEEEHIDTTMNSVKKGVQWQNYKNHKEDLSQFNQSTRRLFLNILWLNVQGRFLHITSMIFLRASHKEFLQNAPNP